MARSRRALGDRAGAIAAYERVPDSSSAHVDAQVAVAEELLDGNGAGAEIGNVLLAATIVDLLPVDSEQRRRLAPDVLEAALAEVHRDPTISDPTTRVLDRPRGRGARTEVWLVERDIRLGLEEAYRALARHAATAAERIEFVDRANQVRPRSLF